MVHDKSIVGKKEKPAYWLLWVNYCWQLLKVDINFFFIFEVKKKKKGKTREGKDSVIHHEISKLSKSIFPGTEFEEKKRMRRRHKKERRIEEKREKERER